MSADSHSPPLVSHDVIDTFISGVARRLHGIASEGARSSRTVACANVDRVCGMAKVICSCVASRLWRIRIGSRRDRKTQSRSRERFWHGFESHGRQAVSKGQEGRNSASKRMTRYPNVGVWILLSDIGVELASGTIVTVLFNESRPDACVVTGISAGSAIADLVPRPLSLLSAAATKEQVIINLVVGRCAISVKDSG